MSGFSEDSSSESSRKREYLKQQQLLRSMKTKTPISADDMIENLLSKKEIFQKKKESNPVQAAKQSTSQQWPIWITPGKEPSFYRQVWSVVGLPSGLADTTKTSSLLLTSRLSTDTLGFIWSLTNLTVPGSLTQQELNLSLALVALAQNGYTFMNADVVKQLKEAPLPKLDFDQGTAAALPSPSGPPSLSLVNTQQFNLPTVTETLSLLDLSSEPLSLLESSPTKSLSVLSATDLTKDYPSTSYKPEQSLIFNNFQADDDFDDFKSADFMSSQNLTVLDIKDETKDTDKEPLKKEIFVNPLTPEIFDKATFKEDKVEDLFPCVLEEKTEPPSLITQNEDRYSALRILDTGTQDTQEFDEFGDFLTATEPSKQPDSLPDSQTDVQLKCLEACLKLMKEAVNLFESLDDQILQEVTSDERGKTYLEEIVEVERIGRRIRANRENCSLISEFEKLSIALKPHIDLVKNNYMEEQEGPKCGLCLMEFGPAHVKYGINHFHAPCANLYLHNVDPILPIAPVM